MAPEKISHSKKEIPLFGDGDMVYRSVRETVCAPLLGGGQLVCTIECCGLRLVEGSTVTATAVSLG